MSVVQEVMLDQARQERDMCEQVLADAQAEIARLKTLWYADIDPIETEYAEDYRARAALAPRERGE